MTIADLRPDRPIAITISAETFDSLHLLASRYGMSPAELVKNTASNLALLATLVPKAKA